MLPRCFGHAHHLGLYITVGIIFRDWKYQVNHKDYPPYGGLWANQKMSKTATLDTFTIQTFTCTYIACMVKGWWLLSRGAEWGGGGGGGAGGPPPPPPPPNNPACVYFLLLTLLCTLAYMYM